MNDERRTKLIQLLSKKAALDENDFRNRLNELLGGSHFGWELGPDPTDENVTVLSLSLLANKEAVLDLSSALNLPISTDSWRVQVGIPPRSWDRYFEYRCDDGREYEIVGDNWKFRIENTLALTTVFVTPDMLVERHEKTRIAQILVIGEIGEANMLKYVEHLIVSDEGELESKPMRLFRSEFLRRFPDCEYAHLFKFFADQETRA